MEKEFFPKGWAEDAAILISFAAGCFGFGWYPFLITFGFLVFIHILEHLQD